MKSIRTYIVESLHSNIDKFKKYLKLYGLTMEGPDSVFIAYIYDNNSNKNICIDVSNKNYWVCYFDEDNNHEIWLSNDTDEDANLVKADIKCFDLEGDGFKYSKKNAKELANIISNN